MPRPTGTNIVQSVINPSNAAESVKGKTFVKTVTFAPEMKDILEAEAKKRGMTMAGFIKFCVAKVINDKL